MPTIPLARDLIELGISVLYLTSSTMAPYLQQRGFNALPIDTGVTVPGNNSTVGYDIEQSGRSFWRQFGGRGDRAELLRSTIANLLSTYPINAVVLDDLFYRKGDLYPSNRIRGIPILRVLTSLPRWDEVEIAPEASRWVLCPPQFELDCFVRKLPRTHFAEPSIDWGRPEVQLPQARVGTRRPLVLYSAGTQSIVHVNAGGRLNFVLEAAAMLSDCDFIVATGSRYYAHELSLSPPNVVLVTKIPQLALLQEASLLITHGGLGSIKEAICCNVPLLVLPVVFDQPYNAMRVRKKRVGEAIYPEHLTGGTLRDGVLGILDSVSISRSVSSMRELFLDKARRRPFLEAILQNIGHASEG
jgi:UDP:flavonoid glycosyltransferase YjiC (YdhE family)